MIATQTTSKIEDLLETRKRLMEEPGFRWASKQLRKTGHAELAMLEMHDDDVRGELVGEEHLEGALRRLCKLLRDHDSRAELHELRRQFLAEGGKLHPKLRSLKIFEADRQQRSKLASAIKGSAQGDRYGRSSRRRRRQRTNPVLARGRYA